MKKGFFSKVTAILLAVSLCIPGLPKTVKADPVPEPITGEISSSVTWSDGDIVGGVTIHGGTADAPVVISIEGTVNVTGEIDVVDGYVKFNGLKPGTAAPTLVNAAGGEIAGDPAYAMIRIRNGASVTLTGTELCLNGGYSGNLQKIKYGIYNENSPEQRSSLLLSDWVTMERFETAGVYGPATLLDSSIYYCGTDIDGADGTEVELSGVTFIRSEDSVGISASCKVFLSGGAYQIDSLDRSGPVPNDIFVKGSIAAGSSIKITNISLYEGEVILAKPDGSYTITNDDASRFSYVLGEWQSNWTVTGPTLSDGNVVVNVYDRSMPVTGVINSSVTWSSDRAVGAVTVHGGTAEAPVVITIEGTVDVTGEITVADGYVVFKGGTDEPRLRNAAAEDLGTDPWALIRVKEGASVKLNSGSLSLWGEYSSGSMPQQIKYGIYNENPVDQVGSLELEDISFSGFEAAAIYGPAATNTSFKIDLCGKGFDGAPGTKVKLRGALYIYDNTVGITSNCSVILAGGGYHIYSIERGGLSECGVFVGGSVVGQINITNVGLTEGEVILAKPSGSYTITDDDLTHFSYSLTESQNNWTVTGPALSGGNVVINAHEKPGPVTGDIYDSVTWNSDQAIGAVTIHGGATADQPVIITVDGSVDVTAEINVAEGYVIFTGTNSAKLNDMSGDDDYWDYNYAMIRVADGANVSITSVTLNGAYVGLTQAIKYGVFKEGSTGSLDLESVTISNISVVGAFGPAVFTNCAVTGCRTGIGADSGEVIELIGTTVTNNITDISSYCSVKLSGPCQIGSLNRDSARNSDIYVKGAISGYIQISDLELSEGEVILAKPCDGYTITAADAACFSYVPTAYQSKWSVSAATLSDGNVVVNVHDLTEVVTGTISQPVTWTSMHRIDTVTIAGSSDINNPLIITIDGTVTVSGTITTTGYVKIVGGTNGGATLEAMEVSSRAALANMITSSGSGLIVDGVSLNGGSGLFDTGILVNSKTEIRNSSIRNFNIGIENEYASTLLDHCEIYSCRSFGLTGTGSSPQISGSEFLGNGCAIDADSCVLAGDNRICNNTVGIKANTSIRISGERVYITGNNDADIDLNNGTVELDVDTTSFISDCEIRVTNAVITSGQAFSLAKITGYDPNVDPATFFRYVLTPAQEREALEVGSPYFDSGTDLIMANVSRAQTNTVTIDGGDYANDLTLLVKINESIGDALSRANMWDTLREVVEKGGEYYSGSALTDSVGTELDVYTVYPAADMTIYRKWVPVIMTVYVYVDPPVCGTEVAFDEETYMSIHSMTGRVPDGAPYSVRIERVYKDYTPFSGTIDGEATYALFVRVVSNGTMFYEYPTFYVNDVRMGMDGFTEYEFYPPLYEIQAVHAYEWEVVTPATATAPGLEAYKCTGCGKVLETREIPATPSAPVITGDVSWADGSTVGPVEIVGGDSWDNAVTVTVGGTVTVTDTINVTSGYVKFVAEAGTTAILKAADANSTTRTAALNAKGDSSAVKECMLNAAGVSVSLSDISLQGNEKFKTAVAANSSRGLGIYSCAISGFKNGIVVNSDLSDAFELSVYYSQITDCELYGIQSAVGSFHLEECEITNCSVGIEADKCFMCHVTVTGNTVGVNVKELTLAEWDTVADNTEADIDLDEGRNTILVISLDETRSRICVTNAVFELDTEVILAKPEYSPLIDSDAAAFEYIPTPKQQLSKMRAGAPYISNGNIVVRISDNPYYHYWEDGKVVEAAEFIGSTNARNPYVIEVGGTVTLNGTISFAGGYVTIVAEEGTDAVLKSGSQNGYLFVGSYTSNVTITEITIDGNDISPLGICGYYGTLTVDSCEVKKCTENGINIFRSATVTVRNSRITGYAQSSYSTGIRSESSRTLVESTMITDANIGFLGSGILKDVTITDNVTGVRPTNNGLQLTGLVDISGNTNADLDLCGYYLYLVGALTEGSHVNLTNAVVSGVGEVILVRPAENYVIQASDADAFTYTPTAAQLEGNEVFKKIRLSDNGNIVMPVVYYDPVHLSSCALSLNGDIGVKFYLDIPKIDAPYAVIHFEFRGNTYDYRVAEYTPVAEPVSEIDEFTDQYCFTVRASAKEMRDLITVTVTDEEGNKITFRSHSGNTDYTETGYSYSVSRYFELVRSKPGYESLIPLVDAMDNYGKYAQLYFGYNASGLEVDDVSDVTLDILNGYKNVKQGTLPEGLTYAGSWLTLETVTKYSHNFTLEDGHDISEYRFEVDGVEVTPKNSGSTYTITVENISAKNLGDFTTTIVYDSNNDPVYSIKYCALSYARAVVKAETREADVCRALYKYYVAAKDYFDNH